VLTPARPHGAVRPDASLCLAWGCYCLKLPDAAYQCWLA
jgi:hypothetical protein